MDVDDEENVSSPPPPPPKAEEPPKVESDPESELGLPLDSVVFLCIDFDLFDRIGCSGCG